MRYSDRKEFLYEPNLFDASDTQIALRIQDEYVYKGSAKPYPIFFEVDRESVEIDDVFHSPVSPRTQFSRTLDIPALVTFEKPSWTMTRIGLTPQQRYKMWLSNLSLKKFNYFPTRGDFVAYNGYRLFISRCAPDPEAYWQQTGVWLGITAEVMVVPEGDARPLDNTAVEVPAEKSQAAPVKPGWAANALPFPHI